MRKLVLAVIAAVTLTTLSLHAGLPLYDPFADATGSGGTSYSIGANLIGQTNAQGVGWVNAGSASAQPTINAGSLSIDGLYSSGGNSVGWTPASGTSAKLPFGSVATSGTFYYSLALDITSISAVTTSGAFIMGFNNNGSASSTSPSVVGARLYVRNTGLGTYNLGLNKADGTAADITWDSTAYNPNTTLFVVGSYTLNTTSSSDDTSSLWINPSSSTFGSATAPGGNLTASAGNDISSGIGSLVLRDAATTEPSVIVDDVRAGTSYADVTPPVPEPATAALGGLGLGLLALMVRSRRSR